MKIHTCKACTGKPQEQYRSMSPTFSKQTINIKAHEIRSTFSTDGLVLFAPLWNVAGAIFT